MTDLVASTKILAVACTIGLACSGCGSETAGNPVPTSSAAADGSGALFQGTQPWTIDVTESAVSDRSDAIIEALNSLGGWGNDNVFQTDFSIPVFFADSSTPRVEVVGTEGYCFDGPACDGVPAQMPLPADANFEGSPDLTCDPSGNTDPNAPPYGVRFRLKADVDEAGYSDAQKVILNALKTHGMLLSDGGEIAMTFADDRTSTAKWSELGIDAQSFSALTVDQFEVVDLGDEIPLTYDCVRNP